MKGLSIQRKLWLIAGIYFIINALQSFFTPLINDEAYYWVWSRDLAWGYYDHPPMVALWAKIGFYLLENELGNRLIAIIFASLGFVLLGKLLEIKNGRQLQLYVCLFFSMVLFQVFGFVNTPDAPLLFFGILYFYVLKKFLKQPSIWNSLGLGLAMALLIYSKYHGILLIIFSLLPHTFKLIKSKYFYIAVFTGILCYVPHIIWQFNHDFVSLQYHLVRRNVKTTFKLNNLGDYLLSLIWASSPLLFYYHVQSIFKTKYKTAFDKSLICALLGIIGFFIMIALKRYIQAQWSLVAFIPALIITYNYYKDKTKNQQQIQWLSIATLVLITVARIYFIMQEVPFNTQYHGWKAFSKKAGEVTQGIAVFEKYQYTSLFNFNNYPEKEAHNYITLENRESQYNLLDSESRLEGKEITFFSKYLHTQDSIILEEGNPDAVFYYKHIPVYHTAVNVEMKFSDADMIKQRDSIYIKTLFINHGDFPVHLSPENGFTLKRISVEAPYSNHVIYIENVAYKPIDLKPHQSIIMPLIVTDHTFDEYDNAVSYLSLVYDDLPAKKQSDYIEEKLAL